jgi:hypothetical protein
VSQNPTIGRRTFMGLALGGAAAVGAGVAWRSLGQDDNASRAEDNEPPSPDDATAAVGERYLTVAPAGTTTVSLRAALGPGVEAAWKNGDVEAVAAAVREDFVQEDTVEVDGWVLSETECRLAALVVV